MSKLTVLEDIIAKWTKADKEAQIEGVKRLGLKPDNTAQDRAKAMGFGDTQYHGTHASFDEFGNSRARDSVEERIAKQQAWDEAEGLGLLDGSMNPDEVLAMMDEQNNFNRTHFVSPSSDVANFFSGGGSAKIDALAPKMMPLRTRGKIFDFDNPEHINQLTEYNYKIDADEIKEGWYGAIEEPEVQKAIRDLGFDGFHAKEHEMPPGYSSVDDWKDVKNTGLYNGTDMRSPFAHFNPKMAGVGAGSILSADLMANENNKGNMSNTFFDDISKRAEERRRNSFATQKRMIESGLKTNSVVNNNSGLTNAQIAEKQQLLEDSDRRAYSELMALPVGAIEGMLGIGGDIELLGQGIKGAYNADSGNRWEGFKEGLSDRDTMFWSTLDNQERTDKWLEGTEFGDRLKEGAGGRLVGEILAPLPPVAGVAKYGNKALGALDEGVTATNRVLNKYDIQPGLSIKDVSPKSIIDENLPSRPKSTQNLNDSVMATELPNVKQDYSLGNSRATVTVPDGYNDFNAISPTKNGSLQDMSMTQAQKDYYDTLNKTHRAEPVANTGEYSYKPDDMTDVQLRMKDSKTDEWVEIQPGADDYNKGLLDARNGADNATVGRFASEPDTATLDPYRFQKRWEFIDGKPTGTGKTTGTRVPNEPGVINADGTKTKFRQDSTLTYDGSEFPPSEKISQFPGGTLDGPSNKPFKVSEAEPQVAVGVDANKNIIYQPAEGFNSLAVKNMQRPELERLRATSDDWMGNKVDNSIKMPQINTKIQDTQRIPPAMSERLSLLPTNVKDKVYKARNKDSMIKVLEDYRADVGNKAVVTAKDIKNLKTQGMGASDHVNRAVKNADSKDNWFTQRELEDNFGQVNISGNAKEAWQNMHKGMTDAEAIKQAKKIQKYANNYGGHPDTVINNLTRNLTKFKALPNTVDNKQLIEGTQQAIRDVFDRNYRGVEGGGREYGPKLTKIEREIKLNEFGERQKFANAEGDALESLARPDGMTRTPVDDFDSPDYLQGIGENADGAKAVDNAVSSGVETLDDVAPVDEMIAKEIEALQATRNKRGKLRADALSEFSEHIRAWDRDDLNKAIQNSEFTEAELKAIIRELSNSKPSLKKRLREQRKPETNIRFFDKLELEEANRRLRNG
jgi:hypothetical protein